MECYSSIDFFHFLALLVCFALLSSLSGCMPATGEMTYAGICSPPHPAAGSILRRHLCFRSECVVHSLFWHKYLDKLKTGDKITIKVICLAYEDVEFSERRLLNWSKDLFGHTNVSKASLQHIENLVAQYESP